MDRYSPSVAEFAAEIGVDASTVYRSLRREHLVADRTITAESAATLRKRFGVVPKLGGYTRMELLLLAGLSLSPLGVRSVRAAARRGSLSSTCAAKTLTSLVDRGLVVKHRRRLAEGRVIDCDVWAIDITSPEWHRIARHIGKIVVPSTPDLAPATRVPPRLGHHFWTGSSYGLDVTRDGAYIASRLALSDDPQAMSWAASHLPAKAFRECATARGLSAKQRSLLAGMAADADGRGA